MSFCYGKIDSHNLLVFYKNRTNVLKYKCRKECL
nr:MAG TPA: hypothetical protein [Caudoviricetes sp.]